MSKYLTLEVIELQAATPPENRPEDGRGTCLLDEETHRACSKDNGKQTKS